MTAVELDPVFVKALKLLHSKAKDSGAQLKAMLDDAIAQRKGLKVPAQAGDAGKSSPGRSKSDDDTKRKEAEKRSSDKSSKDPSEPETKKSKVDSKSRSKDEREAREKEKEKERAKREKEKKEKEERDAQKQREKAEKEKKEKELASSKVEAAEVTLMSDEEEQASQMDAGDFALEMGIACVVCRQFDVSSGNQLVECQECHSLYHQECHKPPVTEEDVSDPRFVWYCSRCTKSLKKMVTQKPTKPKPPVIPATSGKEFTLSTSKAGKIETSTNSTSQAFRRIDPKPLVATPKETTTVTSSTSKPPMVGLAGLAANLVKPRGESKSGSSSRKSDPKGDGSKSSSKSEGKSCSGNKSDSSSKSTSSTSSKSEDKKTESSKSSSSSRDDKEKDKEKKSESSSKSSSKSDEKKSSDSSSKSSPTSSGKEDKKSESGSKSEKKSEAGKSPSHAGLAKLEVPSPRNSPPHAGTVTTPTTPDSPSGSSKSSSSASNKQAIANLSMVTANKRMQMMKKKAQTKPGGDKKVHIK